MKLKLDKRYTKFCKYLILTAVIIYLLFRLVDAIPSFYDNLLDLLTGFFDISFPIILGFIIAYLLFAPMNAIECFLMKRKHFPHKRGLCRAIGLIISYICLFAVVIFLIVGIYFMIGGQLSQSSTVSAIFNTVTEYFSNNSLSSDALKELIVEKNIPFGDLIISQLDNITKFLQDIMVSLVEGIGNFIIALGSNIFSLAVSLILSIYVLYSHEYFSSLWDRFFFIVFRNSKAGKIIKRSLHTINYTFSKYIRGQLIEASIVAVLSTLVLSIIGVDYAIVIGIIAGVCNLVPYIGPFVGIVLAGIVALFSGHIWLAVAAVIGLFIVQQIDCNILCPKIVGDIVGMHPGFIIIAITIGGNFAGLLGMLIAVPVAASFKTIISDWFDYYIKAKYEKYKADNQNETLDRDTIVSAFDLSDKPIKETQKTNINENQNTDNEKIDNIDNENTDNIEK